MKKMDLLIRGGLVFNAYFKKFIKEDIVINDGRIFFVGDTATINYDYQKIIDAPDQYIIPGLIDIHMHIESSMATPQAFSREVVRHGVTTIVSEPHEIANVFGMDGILEMIKAGEEAEVDIYYAIPSSVPSTSNQFETTGAEIGLFEITELIRNDRVICLGEVMNCHELIDNPDSKIGHIVEFFRQNYPHLPIEGHCPRISGAELARLLEAGVTSDHTQQTVQSLAEKIEAGMFIEIQEKSVNKENIDYIVANHLTEHIALVTDDVMADKLVREGQLDHLVKKAIELGMPAEEAIYCATYTPARRMNLMDRGSIAPGKLADLVILNDLVNFKISSVYKNGISRLEAAQPRKKDETFLVFPARFMNSIQRQPVNAIDLQIKASKVNGTSRCRMIQVHDGSTSTKEIIRTVNVKDGKLEWEDSPYGLIAVLERYGKSNRIGLGLITGDTIQWGAVAASYAHDHHNIIAVGRNIADLVKAVNTVIESQGGYFVVKDGRVLAGIELPIGGILSGKEVKGIGRDLAGVTAAMKELGYKHYNPVMSLSTNALPVSPFLKITDRGLYRFDLRQIVDIEVEE